MTGLNNSETMPEAFRLKAMKLAEMMNEKDHQGLVRFGAEEQKKLAAFANTMLNQVRKQDVSDAGGMIGDLTAMLQDIDPDDLMEKKASFIGRLFRKSPPRSQEILSRFQKTGAQIDRLGIRLEMSQSALLADIDVLERLYEANQQYYESLNLYIAAGELKLREVQDRIELNGSEEDSEFAEHLEKRLFDLKVSREIARQSAPQIRMIQKANHMLAEKIQSSIMTLIPLWKNQVTIALSLARQSLAANAEAQAGKASEALAGQNKMLLEIESLKRNQLNLLSSLEETGQMEREGRMKREQAEQKLMHFGEGDINPLQ
ncbi:toxic anion resistance protein [Metabacillus sp. GX 13764]|uniref:toxic anion resistance protein n=1 Tax=Metabacillus kandeliae TaxID=2900151 RepID=UPI001E51AA06|nr:toxic anion resistance protein [Metabacillus kandeliae]MCD7034065.1 toxic anion resistance protein [Metabacillus kandeliae]